LQNHALSVYIGGNAETLHYTVCLGKGRKRDEIEEEALQKKERTATGQAGQVQSQMESESEEGGGTV